MKKMYSLSEAASLLGTQAHRIQYALVSGKVAEPEIRIAGKRVFQQGDIERLAEHFNVELKQLDEEKQCNNNMSS